MPDIALRRIFTRPHGGKPVFCRRPHRQTKSPSKKGTPMENKEHIYDNATKYDMKVEFSPQTNLIEQAAYHYSLQERETPNLYRQLFDYDSVPRVAFNHRSVPENMPSDIWITDTTFRDGQQSTSPSIFTSFYISSADRKDLSVRANSSFIRKKTAVRLRNAWRSDTNSPRSRAG